MQTKRDKLKVSSIEYLERFIGHKSLLNHKAILQATELQPLHTRSVENLPSCYDPSIQYEDNSSYSEVCKAQIYGVTKLIAKKYHVGQITEHIGIQLGSR